MNERDGCLAGWLAGLDDLIDISVALRMHMQYTTDRLLFSALFILYYVFCKYVLLCLMCIYCKLYTLNHINRPYSNGEYNNIYCI